MNFLSSTYMSSSRALPFTVLFLATSTLIHHVSAQQSQSSISSLDTTQVTGLMPACANVYNATISGCALSDFLSTNPCSSACLTGLQSVQMEAQTACQGNDIPANSMLSYFVNGQGINQLCSVMKMVGGSTTMSATTKSTASTSTSSMGTSATATATGTAASASASATATAPQGGVLGLPRITLIAIIVGSVVALMLLAVLLFCAFRVHYK